MKKNVGPNQSLVGERAWIRREIGRTGLGGVYMGTSQECNSTAVC